MVLTSGHPRRIENCFRVECSNQIGASQGVHKGETLWLSSTPHSYFVFSKNIDQLFFVIWLSSCLHKLQSRRLLLLHHNLSKRLRTQRRVRHWHNLPNSRVSLRKKRNDILRRKIRHSSVNGLAIPWWIYRFVQLKYFFLILLVLIILSASNVSMHF